MGNYASFFRTGSRHPSLTINSGGAYLSAVGNIKKIDGLERILTMEDGTIIHLDDILDIQADLSDD